MTICLSHFTESIAYQPGNKARAGKPYADILKADVEVFYQRDAVETQQDHPLVIALQETAQSVFGRPARVRAVDFFTDASVLQPPTGIPTVLFGPGDTGLMHQTDERIQVQDIITASRVFALLPVRLL